MKKCARCSKQLTGIADTTTQCRVCADKHNAHRQKKIDDGLCRKCHKPRGPDGTGTRCRPCADEDCKYQTEYQKRKIADGKCASCGTKRQGRSKNKYYCIECSERDKQRFADKVSRGLCGQCGKPREVMESNKCNYHWAYDLVKTKDKTKHKVTITPEEVVELYIKCDGKCELCGGILMRHGFGEPNDRATLDRIIPELGYVSGNVGLLHAKCNDTKGDNTPETIKQILKYTGWKL